MDKDENLSEMTEIQMFSVDGASEDRNASRGSYNHKTSNRTGVSINAPNETRPSFVNPYLESSNKQAKNAPISSGLKTNNTSAPRTNTSSE